MKLLEVEKKDSEISVIHLAEILINYFKHAKVLDEYVEYSVEGLMYLSLYWKVRELIRMDVNLIKLFLAKLKETSTDSTNINTSFQYGVLSIFSNLTKTRDTNDKESNSNTRNRLKQQQVLNMDPITNKKTKKALLYLTENYLTITKLYPL